MKVHALFCLCVATACTTASVRDAELQPKAFEVVEAFDAPGDRLEIEEILSDRAVLEAGATLRARGRYHLESASEAQIYFGLTNGEIHADPPRKIAAGEGTFDLTLTVVRPGQAHVSLYAGGGPNNCIGKRRIVLEPRH
ncbi:MAG: hypothetical protein JNL28_04420 [Planctomycetes bacterium]|nr:hypothetical protein [Planctomycetota bacterium]